VKICAGFGFNLLLAAAMLTGCNPPADYALVGSAFVPAAHGDIRIEKIDKQQKLITVTMDHLPLPEEIEAGVTHYVVWFAAVGALPTREGVLEYDRETRVGRASIPTSMLDFDVRVTAEQSDSPVQPSDLVVASQRVREQ
jgi:hypothetical protein